MYPLRLPQFLVVSVFLQRVFESMAEPVGDLENASEKHADLADDLSAPDCRPTPLIAHMRRVLIPRGIGRSLQRRLGLQYRVDSAADAAGYHDRADEPGKLQGSMHGPFLMLHGF
jgi:hypothetical protein